MEVSDEKLIKLCQDQNMEGFDLLYTKYQSYIYRLCYNYTHSKEDSLDLLQEVYIKIYQSIPRFEKGHPLSPWIKKITINTCHNFARAKKPTPLPLDPTLSIPSADNVELALSYKSTEKLLKTSISQLPHEIKSVILLRHVEAMSYQEISQCLSIPIGTVKTHLFRGRKHLKDQLKKEGVWEV
ncbi:RNA polymerase sigma factor [Alkaliphilus metalliredigens]|uniref:RNA polymerase sigma factor n=1 Tax=Alkaliphilus metalliredigens TaxID=208226 RepID=UPI0005A07228|nr:RNA polymerase sigma factor [Alkaliphilus metalliredigens]